MLSCFFFFKQKTAYEMRISDCSSDVCSSDLALAHRLGRRIAPAPLGAGDGVADEAIVEVDEHAGSGRGAAADHGAAALVVVDAVQHQIGRASCRERVCQYV